MLICYYGLWIWSVYTTLEFHLFFFFTLTALWWSFPFFSFTNPIFGIPKISFLYCSNLVIFFFHITSQPPFNFHPPSLLPFASSPMESTTVESTKVESGNGIKLHTRLFKPSDPKTNLVIVLVHPYTVLGGFQGLLRGIATKLAEKGYRAVTFDMRGAGRSTGRASLTGFSEIEDVVAVCKWVTETINPEGIVLVGSSAGAPIAGSAVDKLDNAVGYVSLGYPFGMTASILFGRHHQAILKSSKPKLFVMGTNDGFTSVKQLENKLKNAVGRAETQLLEGVGHFQMEGPSYDSAMVDLIIDFVSSL